MTDDRSYPNTGSAREDAAAEALQALSECRDFVSDIAGGALVDDRARVNAINLRASAIASVETLEIALSAPAVATGGVPVAGGRPVMNAAIKGRSRPWHNPTPLVGFQPEWLGQFDTFDDWVNHATRAIGDLRGNYGEKISAVCFDAKGRRCNIGGDFQRAREEGAFPIRYFVDGAVALGSEEEKGYARGLKDGQAFAKIPGNLFWMAAKGRLKSSEPLYAVQIIDPESGVHLTATQAETLEEAISASVSALVVLEASTVSSNPRGGEA